MSPPAAGRTWGQQLKQQTSKCPSPPGTLLRYLFICLFAVLPDSGDGAVMLWWPPARDPAPVLRALISPRRSHRVYT